MRGRHSQAAWSVGAATIIAATFAAGLALDLVSSTPAPPPTPSASAIDTRTPRGEIIVFIVLDNVRADRMGLCGHARPTTPFLSEACLASEAVCRCQAYSPGSWTIPSHASFFTGLEVERHGVGSPASLTERDRTKVFYRTLPASIPTLAEGMQARGFRTAAISANPVLDATSGLLRGFEEQTVAKSFEQLRGEALVALVRQTLEHPDPDGRPLFLFVNLIDAHEPWARVPDDLDWLPRRQYLRFTESVESYRTRFMRGQLEERESEALLSHFSDIYDYGVFRADETLRRIVEVLHDTGWMAGRHRIVITSDHGELLGEHGALGHGAPLLYEGLSRVPLVVLSNTPTESPLPHLVSSLTVFDLLRGMPTDRSVHAAAFAAPGWQKRYGSRWGHRHGAAIWTENERYMLVDGESLRFDLSEEASGSPGSPLADGPEKTRLEAVERQLEQAAAAAIPDGSEEITQMLRALGYVE